MFLLFLCSVWMWTLIIRKFLFKSILSPDDNTSTICTLSEIAPLLGLLGTITGMITAFEIISRNGSAGGKDLADAISEALITTQTGLAIALPGVLIGYVSAAKSKKITRKSRERHE